MGILNGIANFAVELKNKVFGESAIDSSSSSYVSKPSITGSGFDDSKSTSGRTGETYTIKAGDTLWKIASKNGLTVKDILDANPKIKNPDMINEGDKINIPKKTDEQKQKIQNQSKVAETKQKAIKAQEAFKNAPNRTAAEREKELELQKDFIKAFTDWAKAVIDDKSVSKHDITDVISSIKGLKQYQNAEVANLQQKLNALLPELREKLNPGTATTKTAQEKKEKAQIDTVVANDFAKVATKKAAAINTHMSCAGGVRQSLEQSGLLKPGETVGKSAGEYEAFFDKNKDRFQKVTVEKQEDLKNLPAGYIVIFKPTGKTGDSDWKKNDGHIFVTTGDGREASDHVKNIKLHDDMEYVVYAPKKQSTEQKVKSAFEARDAYLSPGVARNADNQRCYLTHYINAAEALLKDGDASPKDIRALVAKLKEVPANNQSDVVQDLVQKTQVLLKKLESKFGL